MRTFSSIVVSASLLAAAAAPLNAQRLKWGPQISYNFSGTSNHVGVGARVERPLTSLLASAHVDGILDASWFPATTNVFTFTGNVVYRFQTPNLQPYAGGGLSLWFATGIGASPTRLQLDAVGGLKLKPMGRVTPLVELRYVFGQGDALLAMVGLLF